MFKLAVKTPTIKFVKALKSVGEQKSILLFIA